MSEPKTDAQDKSIQVIQCGEAVELNADIHKYGLLFISPGMGMFKLFFDIDDEKKEVRGYHFEADPEDSEEVKRFNVVIMKEIPKPPAAPPVVIVPDKKRIIMP